ncbi:Jag N-terminal domain-containing protein, partial [Bacillus sp. SS-TM]
MSVITAKGQTVELAVEDALRQLNTSKDRVDINIVDEGKRGFLGLFGNRPAVVVVVLKKDPIQECEEYLRNVIHDMGVEVEISDNEHKDLISQIAHSYNVNASIHP